MDPVCLYALPTSGHAPDLSADIVLGDLLPDLDQGISASHTAKYHYSLFRISLLPNAPYVVNWI